MNITVGSQIRELAEKYPNIKEIQVDYEGSGDSFGDFWNIQITPRKKSKSKIKKEEKQPSITEMEDLLWYAIDHSEADFNNEGSEGDIIINLDDLSMTINNRYVVRETVPGETKEFTANTLLTKEDY